jgi:hypothetical protein
MADTLHGLKVRSVLITVVVGIQLVVGAKSLAQFVREEITIRVHGACCTLDGRYEFRNTGDHAVLWPIFYPLLNTDAIPLADSVHIHDAETEELLPFESGVNGVSFAFNMPPCASKVIRISYRQRTPKKRMDYVLTSTKQWGKPLESATFRVVIPDSLRLTHMSIPYDSLTKRGHNVEYIIQKKAFMPRSNLIIKWERRQP